MSKKMLTRREIQIFWQGLQGVTGDQPLKLSYALARNRSKIRNTVQDIAGEIKPLDDFNEQRIELAKELAKKDPDGQPLMTPNNTEYFVPDMVAFDRRLEEIRIKTGQDKRDKEVEEFLDGTETVDVYLVPFESLPEAMRPDLLEALLPMIIQPDDE